MTTTKKRTSIFCLHLEPNNIERDFIRICLSRKFERGDYLRSVASITEAEEIVKNEKPEFMILNGHGAFEFLDNIRAGAYGEEFMSIPVIAFTAHALSGDREKFLEAGFDAYLPKPANMDQITSLIKQIVPSAN